MKITKTANGNQIKLSKSEWETIGRTAGWYNEDPEYTRQDANEDQWEKDVWKFFQDNKELADPIIDTKLDKWTNNIKVHMPHEKQDISFDDALEYFIHNFYNSPKFNSSISQAIRQSQISVSDTNINELKNYIKENITNFPEIMKEVEEYAAEQLRDAIDQEETYNSLRGDI